MSGQGGALALVGFRPEDYAGLADVAEAYRARFAEVAEGQRRRLRALGAVPGLRAVEERVAAGELLADLERVAREGDLQGYLAERERRIRGFATEGMPYDAVVAGQVALLEPLQAAVLEHLAAAPERAVRALEALSRLRTALLLAAGRAFAELRADEAEREHVAMLRALSTPVLPVWEGVLLAPLAGAVDSARARQLVERVLEQGVAAQARVVILDVSGVPAVDTQVAGYLMQVAGAARLLGARALVVGMSPPVAMAVARLGVDLAGVETYLDLRSGLERALALCGYAVRRVGAG